MAISSTVFKLGLFPTPPLFDARIRGNPLEFLDDTYPAKTRGMGLPYDENFIILCSTVFDWCTRVTDGQRIDWLSMVLHLRQHNIGYTAEGFYRSDDQTNSVKALKEGG